MSRYQTNNGPVLVQSLWIVKVMLKIEIYPMTGQRSESTDPKHDGHWTVPSQSVFFIYYTFCIGEQEKKPTPSFTLSLCKICNSKVNLGWAITKLFGTRLQTPSSVQTCQSTPPPVVQITGAVFFKIESHYVSCLLRLQRQRFSVSTSFQSRSILFWKLLNWSERTWVILSISFANQPKEYQSMQLC